MSDKKKHICANKYLQYLKGELSNQERHSFERNLEANSFEKEALEGFETITTDQAEEDMLTMHNRLRKRLSKRRRVAFYSIAATVASLLIVGTVFLQIHDFNPKGKEKQLVPEGSFSTSPSEPVQDQQGIETGQEAVQEAVQEVVVEPAEATEVIEMDEELEVSEEIEILEFIAAPEMQAERAAPVRTPLTEDKKTDQITYTEAQAIDKVEEGHTDKAIVEPESDPGPVSTSKKRTRGRKETLAQPVAAQHGGKVSGVVISAEDQEPIPGANIAIRGLNTGTVTDRDGRFDLPLEEESNTTLVASYIGMETQEYPVTEGSDVELVMQPDAVTLDEVVVIGYAVQYESVPTGSVSQVNSSDNKEGADYTGAEPSVGFRDFKTYIEENMQFPLQDSTTQKAVVVLKFKVTSRGEISEIRALRSPGEFFSEEAIRLLKEGPSWNPANNENGTMVDWVRLRIVFKK